MDANVDERAGSGARWEHLLNVVDVEATCWDGQPPTGQVSEIIEIGLTAVDLRAGERVAKHRLLVRPARSTVGPFCTELTGLTQVEVGGGLAFAAACRALAAEHRTDLCGGPVGATTTVNSSPVNAGLRARNTRSGGGTRMPRPSSPPPAACAAVPVRPGR